MQILITRWSIRLSLSVIAQYGGLGLKYKYQAAILEETGNIHCGGVPVAIAVHTDMSTPALVRFGSHELKKEFLEPAIKGDAVTCVGVSEPAAGSDVKNIKTSQEGAPYKNKSLICVPLNVPGVTRRKIEKMGLFSSDWGQLHFDNVKNIIGEPGKGFIYQMMQFQEERLAASLNVVRALDNLISETIDYTRQRKAFGKSILDNQVVHFRICELMTEVEACRTLAYKAVEMYDEGKDVTLVASMVKLKCGRLCREVCDSLLQYWGGMGFTKENIVSRSFRDLRGLSIAGGADEIMLGIIAKMNGLIKEK